MTPAFNYNLNLEREDDEEEGIYAREGLHRPEPLFEIFESLSALEIYSKGALGCPKVFNVVNI